MSLVSDIKLIRTDTTLDLSQKAEKGMPLPSRPAPLLPPPPPSRLHTLWGIYPFTLPLRHIITLATPPNQSPRPPNHHRPQALLHFATTQHQINHAEYRDFLRFKTVKGTGALPVLLLMVKQNIPKHGKTWHFVT